MADEDEGKGANLKKKLRDERLFHSEKQFPIGREENCLPKRQLVIILFETDIVLFAC